MIDNLEKILPFLKFENDDDFYYLQILQRKKENPHLGSNSRVIKNYYIRSQDYLLKHYDEIKTLCKVFNARASIRLNKRSYSKTAFKTMVNLANTMHNHEYQFINKSYDRACGQGHNDSTRKWILDIDGEISKNTDYIADLLIMIDKSKPEGINKVLTHIPSKSGLHIITLAFDSRQFREKFPEIEIHTDNPTNLFIP